MLYFVYVKICPEPLLFSLQLVIKKMIKHREKLEEQFGDYLYDWWILQLLSHCPYGSVSIPLAPPEEFLVWKWFKIKLQMVV